MLAVLEITFFCIIIVIVITQMIIPAIRGTVLFPIFRQERVLENELQSEKQKNVEKELKNDIENLKHKGDKV